MGKKLTRFMASAAILSSAMAINAAEKPVDLTDLILNQDLHTWEGNTNVGWLTDNFFERYQWNVADFYQTLHDMPAGIYTLKCQGFSRNGDNATALANNPSFVYIYINGTEAPLPSLYSEPGYTAEPYNYPDNVSQAMEAFAKGEYQASVTITTTGTQDLKIGQVRKCNDGNPDHDYRARCWYTSSGFKLYYKASENAEEQDVTYKIKNADFALKNGNDINGTGWTYTGNRGLGEDREHDVKEKYEGNFKLTQAISGLQAGKYKVTVQGFLRGRQASWVDENTGELLDQTAYLIANSEKTALMPLGDFSDSVFDFTTKEDEDGNTYEEKTRKPGINDLAAAGISFKDGMYGDNVVFVNIENGEDLVLGLEKAVHEARSWVAFGNFGLFYLPAIAAPTSEDITSDTMTHDFATDGAKHIVLSHEDNDVTIYHKWEAAPAATTVRTEAAKEGFVEHTAEGIDINCPGTLSYYAINAEGQESPVMAVKFDLPTGSAVISAYDNELPAEYYNLQGVKISNPTKGEIVIEKKGSQVRKVIVK